MAENESKSGFNLPWANVVALLAAAGGIFTLIPTLDTSRPPDPGGETMAVFGDQTVDSRLWQDPFEEVLKDQKESKGEGEEHQFEALKKSMAREGERDHKNVWALIVMVNSGPHADPRERRLRTRTAVVEGLSSSGFSPRDSAHVGYIQTPWPRKSRDLFENPTPETAAAEQEMEPVGEENERQNEALPFEWFDRQRDEQGQSAIVLYLQEDACRDRPFTRLAWLSKMLALGSEAPGGSRHVPTTVLGPATSTVLERMVSELAEFNEPPAGNETLKMAHGLIRQQLQGMEFYCPTATASDGALVPAETQRAKEIKKAWALQVAFANAGRRRDLPRVEIPEPAEAKVKDWVSAKIQQTFKNEQLVFQRTIPTDGDIVWETLNELKRRGINPTRWIDDPKNPGHPIDGDQNNCRHSVAIISELDTYYGRALPVAFVEQCDQAEFTKLRPEGLSETASWIHRFHYLRGLDGRLPGEEKEKKPGDTASKEEQKQTPGARPDGHDQTDSLLRLAQTLASEDRKQRNLGQPGYRAIGVLGSDVYDKLLILRALRPMFPGVVFFTNNLDAQFSQPEEWKAAHNLVVISAFGLQLHSRWQRNIPPFRDGYQTSTYLGTLVAAGVIPHEPLSSEGIIPANALSRIMDVPRVFEIGRNGALDLSLNTLGAGTDATLFSEAQVSEKDASGKEILRIHPLRTDLKQWWSTSVLHSTFLGTWPVPVSLALGLLYLAAFAVLFYRGAVALRPFTSEPEASAPATPPPLLWVEEKYPIERPGARHLHRICGLIVRAPWKLLNEWFTLSTLIMGMLGAVLAVLIVSAGYRSQWLAGEPFAWFAGLSIWPGVALRIFGLVLAIHFVFKSYCRVLQSDSEILEHFALGGSRHACEVAKIKDRRWVHTFAPWSVEYRRDQRPALLDPALPFRDRSFDARALWCQYIWRGWWWYRLLRVSALTLFFLFVAWCLFAAFDSGFSASPTRSLLSTRFDHGSMSLLLVTTVFLSLFVVDALWLNASFIRLFSEGFTRWPENVVKRSGRLGLLRESEIAEELDLQLIATRTAAIGEFALYPFVIVALLVVSRAPYFDNWGWTNGLILILATLLGLTILAAFNLRAAAESARKGALSRLRTVRSVALTQDGTEKKIAVLDDMISRIAEMDEGAFAPFSHQPIIRALLFPAGGVGLWELARQVLGKF